PRGRAHHRVVPGVPRGAAPPADATPSQRVRTAGMRNYRGRRSDQDEAMDEERYGRMGQGPLEDLADEDFASEDFGDEDFEPQDDLVPADGLGPEPEPLDEAARAMTEDEAREIDLLVHILPERVARPVRDRGYQGLIEIVLDLGRRPTARYS